MRIRKRVRDIVEQKGAAMAMVEKRSEILAFRRTVALLSHTLSQLDETAKKTVLDGLGNIDDELYRLEQELKLIAAEDQKTAEVK